MSSKTISTLRRQRRSVRRAALEAIRELSDYELRNIAKELGREMNMKVSIVNELRVRLEAVKCETERRRTMTKSGICISDHAVLRYLERHRNVDMQAVREEIISMAQKSGKINSGEQYSRQEDEESGLTLGINGITNVVTTVFFDDHRIIMDIPEACYTAVLGETEP